MALKFNEGVACEAIVRHLESQAKGVRSNMRWPEEEQHQFPIEAAFNIGEQLYAIEHTGIEPFKGHVQMEAEAERLFTPIVDALKSKLDTAAVFELHIPQMRCKGSKWEVRRIQQAIIAWVESTAPTVPRRLYADYKGHSVGQISVPGVPFPLSLFRFEPALIRTLNVPRIPSVDR
jgi:hypothetical protein